METQGLPDKNHVALQAVKLFDCTCCQCISFSDARERFARLYDMNRIIVLSFHTIRGLSHHQTLPFHNIIDAANIIPPHQIFDR